jgi:phosphoglycerol transferase MdoB-like AlkP superfamily enzyme
LQHVPFFIHGPNFIQPKKIERNGNLIDLFPTAASLAKINHTNYTLGVNLLDSSSTQSSSFVYLKINGEPAVGLIQDSLYFSKTTISKTTKLYNLKTSDLKDIQNENPFRAREMERLLEAYYHATKYLYFNNKKSNE